MYNSSSASITDLHYKEDLNLTSNSKWIVLGGLFYLSQNQNSQCGPLWSNAVKTMEAMIFAIKRINEDVSILPNVKLTFDIHDTCGIPTHALQQTLDFVYNHETCDRDNVAVSGVIGAAVSDSSIAAANVLGLFEIPQISYASTAATLSDKTRYKYFFRTVPSDALQAKIIANIIQMFNWTYVFLFYSDDTYGNDGFKYLDKELRMQNSSKKVCLAAQIALPVSMLEDDTVFDMAVDQMSMEWVRNSSIAILFGHPEQAQGMLSAIERKLEADPNSPLDIITWIASDSWANVLDARFYARAEGMLAVYPKPVFLLEYEDYFVNLKPNTTLNPWFPFLWESVFNCSLTSENNSCNLEAQQLPKMATQTYLISSIVQGVYAFALALNNLLKNNCPNETLCNEIIVTRSNGKAVNGELLRRYMLNVSLSNINLFDDKGQFFDKNGDVQNSYTILNLQTDLSGAYLFRPVGSWDHVNLLNISVSDIEWRSGREVPQSVCSLPCGPGQEPVSVPNQAQCCWTCRSCLGEFSVNSGDGCHECEEMFIPNSNKTDCVAVPITYLSWSSTFGIVITVLAALGIIITMSTGVAYLVFINNAVIKASSKELVFLLLVGIFLCYILPFVYLIKPSPASCAVQRLFSGLCFAVVYSALLVKINRMHRIFNRSGSDTPRFVGPISQVVFTLLLTLIQLVIASIWLVIEPPRVKTVLVNGKLQELVCDHNPHAALVVTVVYNVILLTASGLFAFLTRKFPERFNEARFITITVITLCVIWLAFVPTFYVSTTIDTTQIGTHFQIFSLLITLFLSASTTLCCLLLPKLILMIVLKIKARE